MIIKLAEYVARTPGAERLCVESGIANRRDGRQDGHDSAATTAACLETTPAFACHTKMSLHTSHLGPSAKHLQKGRTGQSWFFPASRPLVPCYGALMGGTGSVVDMLSDMQLVSYERGGRLSGDRWSHRAKQEGTQTWDGVLGGRPSPWRAAIHRGKLTHRVIQSMARTVADSGRVQRRMGGFYESGNVQWLGARYASSPRCVRSA
ncbi:hypothetical protein B0H67DRAFT_227147 [Lasiosphaeris hirsuta]|uniref:Uncharacterized protein n=1 Tax=Lasiosphaeris hirsuta TaxID=260670 RepID=A0AA40AFH6_9PEZI|nr:hypothetical protein B0H67DRAFT_227147 [Lasiosphaeris hirsuta]